jgi:hypothetical protein
MFIDKYIIAMEVVNFNGKRKGKQKKYRDIDERTDHTAPA